MIRQICLVALALLAGACGLQRRPPPPLPEGLAIVIGHSAAQLPQAQALLHAELSRVLARHLGWSCGPGGGNQLQLELGSERIETVASGSFGIPLRQRIGLHGRWRLDLVDGRSLDGTWRGEGHAADRSGELRALQEAAEQAAWDLALQFEHRLAAPREAAQAHSTAHGP